MQIAVLNLQGSFCIFFDAWESMSWTALTSPDASCALQTEIPSPKKSGEKAEKEHANFSMPEVQKGDDVEDQNHEDGHKDRDGRKPSEHELAVAGPGRRRGNTYNVVESSEKLCEEFDHSCLRVSLVSRSR
jgi:hypothetical protein